MATSVGSQSLLTSRRLVETRMAVTLRGSTLSGAEPLGNRQRRLNKSRPIWPLSVAKIGIFPATVYPHSAGDGRKTRSAQLPRAFVFGARRV
jgi:hypothetical protein